MTLPKPKFVRDTKELAASVQAFMESPEYWRDAIGSRPKYFVHLDQNGKPLFGLSKFCAFQNIALEDYVVGWRSTTGGGATQKHIARICGKKWMPLASTPPKLQKQFKRWFSSITKEKIGFDEIHLLTISERQKVRRPFSRQVSPEELEARLAAQNKVGKVGEEIAVAHERNRLRRKGAATSEIDVERVSLKNVAAGFDIRSKYRNQIRYIEVKSSTSIDGAIYISPNEISTLKKHGESAFLYIVHVTDVTRKKGTIIAEIRNPFKNGQETSWLNPCLFTGKPPLSGSRSARGSDRGSVHSN